MKKKEQEQHYEYYVGIDVSKLTIDVSCLQATGEVNYHQFTNNTRGYKSLERWLKAHKALDYSQTLYCMEDTGMYTRQLVSWLLQNQAKVWVESPLQIKRSMGMTRGKNDKVDSLRIASYAMSNSEKARLMILTSRTLIRLKDLISSRDRVLKSYQSIRITIKELEQVDKQAGVELRKLNQKALKGLLASKEAIEERISELLTSEHDLQRQYELITSVKGVGKILATELLIYTNGFSRMKNVKQLACYCGVAPFEHSSGTSVKGRTGTSNFANMKLKSTLHMAAISSIRNNGELKTYYERKVAEGKHKMNVINAVRNKLLQRIVAVVKRGTPYQENFLKKDLVLS